MATRPRQLMRALGLSVVVCLVALGLEYGLFYAPQGLPQGAFGDQRETEATEGTGRSSARYALLIGCTEYPNLSPSLHLRGPSNDVPLFQSVLEKFGFRQSDITTLVGWSDIEPSKRPTKRNVEAAFRSLAKTARTDDIVVVLIAGHGCRLPVEKGKNRLGTADWERDGQDEVFLPADAAKWSSTSKSIPNSIRDNEMKEWLDAIRATGAFVWAIFDTCHSGTMTRDALGGDERTRQVRPVADLGVPTQLIEEAREEVRKQARSRSRGERLAEREATFTVAGAAKGGLVSLFAAEPERETIEVPIPDNSDTWYGVLTYNLCQVLAQSESPLTYRELEQQLSERYQAFGRSLPTAFVEGEKDRQVLGLKEWPERSRILLREVDGQWTVSAGSLAGLYPGSILAVYPPGGRANTAELAAYVKVTHSEALQASVEPVAYGDKQAAAALEAGSRCQLVYQSLGDFRLRVAMDPDTRSAFDGGLIQLIRRESEGLLTLADEVQGEQWRIRLENGQVTLLRRDHNQPDAAREDLLAFGPYRYDTSRPERLAKDLREAFRRIYRWENLRRIPGRVATRSLRGASGLEVTFLRMEKQSDTTGTELAPGSELRVGEYLGIRIKNSGFQTLDVTLLFLDAHFGVTTLFPRQNDYCRFARDEELLIPPVRVTKDSIGEEHILTIAVPASGSPVDFAWLEQPSLPRSRGRGEEVLKSALGEFLAHEAYGGTRGLRRTGAPPLLNLTTWTTVPQSDAAAGQ